ncbi:hypothetical protein FACS189413_06090 [Bacteroidia bacterium]|nr:hypothetical protein FACS189413_06090 [Bacteroidia bacterium]
MSERGTKIIEADCASFSDDNTAESELFGYKEGTFTGGLKEGKNGLFVEANGGILFLDEIHNLSKLVQSKLMKAIQTDKNDFMYIRKLGSTESTKIKCKLIFATNKTVAELRDILLPDFYDRIVQHVVELPPLRYTKEDRETDWENTWKYLFDKIKPMPNVPQEIELLNWLKELKLYGNYRDLQKIVMYYNAFNQFDDETKALIEEQSPFEYAKNAYTKYHSQKPSNEQNGILVNHNEK